MFLFCYETKYTNSVKSRTNNLLKTGTQTTLEIHSRRKAVTQSTGKYLSEFLVLQLIKFVVTEIHLTDSFPEGFPWRSWDLLNWSARTRRTQNSAFFFNI